MAVVLEDNSHHPDPNDPDRDIPMDEQFPEGMFRFEKGFKGGKSAIILQAKENRQHESSCDKGM